jgi:hypothetical protein
MCLFLLCAQCKRELEKDGIEIQHHMIKDEPEVDIPAIQKDDVYSMEMKSVGRKSTNNSFLSTKAYQLRDLIRRILFSQKHEQSITNQLAEIRSKPSMQENLPYLQPVPPATDSPVLEVDEAALTTMRFSTEMFLLIKHRAEQVSPLSHAPRRASRLSARMCVVANAQLMFDLSLLCSAARCRMSALGREDQSALVGLAPAHVDQQDQEGSNRARVGGGRTRIRRRRWSCRTQIARRIVDAQLSPQQRRRAQEFEALLRRLEWRFCNQEEQDGTTHDALKWHCAGSLHIGGATRVDVIARLMVSRLFLSSLVLSSPVRANRARLQLTATSI